MHEYPSSPEPGTVSPNDNVTTYNYKGETIEGKVKFYSYAGETTQSNLRTPGSGAAAPAPTYSEMVRMIHAVPVGKETEGGIKGEDNRVLPIGQLIQFNMPPSYDTIGKPSPHLKTFEEAKKDYEGFFKAGETLSKNPIAPFYYMLGERAYPDNPEKWSDIIEGAELLWAPFEHMGHWAAENDSQPEWPSNQKRY